MEVVDKNNKLGESPVWNHFNNILYWVDIDGYSMKQYTDERGIIAHHMTNKPTCISLIDANNLFVAVENGLGIYDFRCNNYTYVHTIDDSNVRMNDGKCDRNGNLYIGTMRRNQDTGHTGSIYQYISASRRIDPIFTSIGISNGISFSKNNEKMYYSDSSTGCLYSINRKNNEKILMRQYDGIAPDGSTVDINDNYYSALWGGYGIDIYQNDTFCRKIELPCKFTTCCCFGGIDMDRLFISSAYNDPTDNGWLLSIPTSTCGIPETPISL